MHSFWCQKHLVRLQAPSFRCPSNKRITILTSHIIFKYSIIKDYNLYVLILNTSNKDQSSETERSFGERPPSAEHSGGITTVIRRYQKGRPAEFYKAVEDFEAKLEEHVRRIVLMKVRTAVSRLFDDLV